MPTYIPENWIDEILAGSPTYNVGGVGAGQSIVLDQTISQAGTPVNAAGLNNIEQALEAILTGWASYDTVIPTRTTSDDPTYIITFAGVDLTDRIGVGMRVKGTQNSITWQGIVTAIAFSINTTVTIYCGTDFDILDTGTYVISDFFYSSVYAPFGFPTSREKWDWVITNSIQGLQASPTATNWYNLGGVSIDVPIGGWDEVTIDVLAAGVLGAGGQISVFCTFSTGAASESHPSWTRKINAASVNLTQLETSLRLSGSLYLAAKTTYYINTKSNQSLNTIYNQNAQSTLVIKLRCAYL